jgi:hypothetical protein
MAGCVFCDDLRQDLIGRRGMIAKTDGPEARHVRIAHEMAVFARHSFPDPLCFKNP